MPTRGPAPAAITPRYIPREVNGIDHVPSARHGDQPARLGRQLCQGRRRGGRQVFLRPAHPGRDLVRRGRPDERLAVAGAAGRRRCRPPRCRPRPAACRRSAPGSLAVMPPVLVAAAKRPAVSQATAPTVPWRSASSGACPTSRSRSTWRSASRRASVPNHASSAHSRPASRQKRCAPLARQQHVLRPVHHRARPPAPGCAGRRCRPPRPGAGWGHPSPRHPSRAGRTRSAPRRARR